MKANTEKTFLHRMIGMLMKQNENHATLKEQPEWVQDLLQCKPGQMIRVMNKEERQKRAEQERQWRESTKT